MFEREALAYAKELREWWKKRESDKTAKRPATPEFIALDLSRENTGSADSIERMVKCGTLSSIRVVIFHEKHGDRVFLVTQPFDFGNIALQIISERNKYGFYMYQREDPIDDPILPKTSPEQVEGMDDEVKATVRKKWEEYLRAKKTRDYERQMKILINKALDGDAIAAVDFLRKSKNNEYENFEVITPEIAKRPKN